MIKEPFKEAVGSNPETANEFMLAQVIAATQAANDAQNKIASYHIALNLLVTALYSSGVLHPEAVRLVFEGYRDQLESRPMGSVAELMAHQEIMANVQTALAIQNASGH